MALHRDDDDDGCIQFGGGDIENRGERMSFDRRESDASWEGDVTGPLLGLSSRINTTSQIAIVGAKVYPIESLDYEYDSMF